ncbi:LysM peptidoglycan-binding domain-containing protein [Alphaproteobacteria bacterium]|jgi:nucleoid-associated protein YgaU|nr:LysM peptidoglycan-binding domain-containing protein [Alphaproteobacteria bacterium]
MNRIYILYGLVIAAVVGAVLYYADKDEMPSEPLLPTSEQAIGLNQKTSDRNSEKKPKHEGKSEAPSFDVVRIEPDGSAVLAGRASPGDMVTIYNGDKPIGSVKTNDQGEWALILAKPLKPGDTELKIVAVNVKGEKTESVHAVVLKVPDRTKTNDGVLAVLVPRAGKATSKLLQAPKPAPGIKKGTLSLDTIDYDNEGRMTFAGRGMPSTSLRIFADNKFLDETTIDSQGNWRSRQNTVMEPGSYTLRLDQVRDGKVTARIEAPFTRSPPLEELKGDTFVVVQPGNSLWLIARRELGGGIRYSIIYEANKHQIKDPDLIYPGQVLAVPEK